MKSTTMNLMLATTALLVASTVASAGDLSANIPFAFRVGGKVLAPGNYYVKDLSGETGFQLRNRTTGDSALLGKGVLQDPRNDWKKSENGVLQFNCGDHGCALRQVWTNSSYYAHAYQGPKDEHSISTKVMVIRLTPGQ
jgi:hypothetical protein